MSALRGDLSSIKRLKARIRTLPTTLAAAVASDAAPAMSQLTQDAFGSNRSVYGEPRPAGADGKPLDLERTGDTKRTLRFRTTGTIVSCVLGTDYARYLIGKYGILPNGALPVAWSRRLERILYDHKVAL